MSWIQGIGDEVLFITVCIILVVFAVSIRDLTKFTRILRLATNENSVVSLITSRDESSIQSVPAQTISSQTMERSDNFNDQETSDFESIIETTSFETNEEHRNYNVQNQEVQLECCDGLATSIDSQREPHEGCNIVRRPNHPTVSRNKTEIKLRLMYMNDTQKIVETSLESTLDDFKRKYFTTELRDNKTIKLIFNGQVLNGDSCTLSHFGLDDNSVLHCLIRQPGPDVDANENSFTRLQSSRTANNNEHNQLNNNIEAVAIETGINIGGLFLPLVSVILAIAWYYRVTYSTYFTTSAMVALVGLTGFAVISFSALYFPSE